MGVKNGGQAPLAVESEAQLLSRKMSPQLHPGLFVFCCLPDFRVPAGAQLLCSFREAEGLTVILEKREAERLGLSHTFEAAMLTMTVESDLAAIGFLARITQALSDARIACNVISAYHHDHLFVPAGQGAQALAVLNEMSRRAAAALPGMF